jgi:nitrogen fixation NifU-like protein
MQHCTGNASPKRLLEKYVMAGKKLYDDLIMDHIKNARNYRALDSADRKASGSNPLCGDELTVYLKIERDRIEDIAFQCTCCGVSMASASIMTESIRGKRTTDVRALLAAFVGMLNRGSGSSSAGADSPERAILATVQAFPVRTRCATLPWVTLEAALDDRQDPVFVR